MMNALMRAFKQKLEEEISKNRTVIDNLSNEIQTQAQIDE